MLAFRTMVLNRYPGTGAGSISRACSVGGQSEHKEGRAWDWGVNAASESDRAKVKDLFSRLLATDEYGNEAALARRLGIMYMIWNRKIWGSWGGWDTYCVQRPRGCVDPDDKDLRHPHTDHVHFSFSWAAARKQTTFWHKERSMVGDIAAHPSYGYWQLARTGSVGSFGTSWYGSKADVFLPKPAAAMASTPTGYGYWLVTESGRVFAFGDARNRGDLRDKELTVVDIEATPSKKGYWLLSRSGRVSAFGAAESYGGAHTSGATFVGMAATATGLGYWLFADNGKVFAYGDALHLGDLAGKDVASVSAGDNFGAAGYWLVTAKGRVYPFGDAPKLGSVKGSERGSAVVGMATTASGGGYWVVTKKGRLFSFGDAAALGSFGR